MAVSGQRSPRRDGKPLGRCKHLDGEYKLNFMGAGWLMKAAEQGSNANRMTITKSDFSVCRILTR